MAKRKASSDFDLLARAIMSRDPGIVIHHIDEVKPEKPKVEKLKISPEGKIVIKKLEAVIGKIEEIIEYIDFDGAPIVQHMERALKALDTAKKIAR